MKFSVSKDELLRKLTIVNPAVSSSSNLPILKTIRLELQGNKLYLRATDTVTYIETWLDVEASEDGACCVDSSIGQVLSAFADKVNVELQKTLKLSYGKSVYRLPIMDADEFPLFPEINDYQTLTSIYPLCEVLAKVEVAVASGGERPVLESFYFDKRYIAAADGFRLSMVGMGVYGPTIIPAKPLRAILGLLKSTPKEVEISLTEWFAVKSDNWQVAVNSLAGEYPDLKDKVDALSASSPVTTVIIPKEALMSKLKVAALFSKRAYDSARPYHMNFEVKGDKTILSMRIESVIDFQEQLSCEKNGEDLLIRLDPKMLQEALNVIKSANVELLFYGNESPIRVVDNDNRDWFYIQMPMLDFREQEDEKEDDF
jgi:DNA polymerase-3 subunit beta